MRLRLVAPAGRRPGPFAAACATVIAAAEALDRRRQGLQRELPRRRAVLVLVALTSCLLTLGAVFGKRGYFERLRYEEQHARLVAEIRELEQSNAGLAALEKELRTSPAAVERLAREELSWGRPGEVLVFLPEAAEAASSSARP